jgi:hypothetical protein
MLERMSYANTIASYSSKTHSAVMELGFPSRCDIDTEWCIETDGWISVVVEIVGVDAIELL